MTADYELYLTWLECVVSYTAGRRSSVWASRETTRLYATPLRCVAYYELYLTSLECVVSYAGRTPE